MTATLQSLIGGRWIGKEAHAPLHSALDSKLIYHTHAEQIDFDEAVSYARKTGVPGLMKLDFQLRAQRLKALAVYLMDRKEELYRISHLTGATRPDSWVDVEGGIRGVEQQAGARADRLVLVCFGERGVRAGREREG